MPAPLVYGLYLGATAAAPLVVRAVNSPAANKLVQQGARLVSKFPKQKATRVANWFNSRITNPLSQTVQADAPSGFAGTITEGTELLPLPREAAELATILGPYMMQQVKSDDFATGLKQKNELKDMDDVKAVIDTASNFDGVTPEEVKQLIEKHLITREIK
jgi:hypothetical protein